jgi:hypothetical protein
MRSRNDQTETSGPRPFTFTTTGLPPALDVPGPKLWIHTYFNAEGQPDSVARCQTPDESGIGRITTHWRYDALRR